MGYKLVRTAGTEGSADSNMGSNPIAPCDNSAYNERQPKCIKLEQTPNGMLMTYRWFSPYEIIGIVFPLVFIAIVAQQAGAMLEFVPWFFVLFFSAPVLLLYLGAAHMVNRTEIALTAEGLRIVNRPLYWPGRKAVSASDLSQLYVDKYYTSSGGGSVVHYRLNGIMRDGKKIVLIKSFQHPDPQIGKFMESMIEKYLMMKDMLVAGEVQ